MSTDRALRCVLDVREVEELSRLRAENERLVQERERMLDFMCECECGGLFGWTPPVFSEDEDESDHDESESEDA